MAVTTHDSIVLPHELISSAMNRRIDNPPRDWIVPNIENLDLPLLPHEIITNDRLIEEFKSGPFQIRLEAIISPASDHREEESSVLFKFKDRTKLKLRSKRGVECSFECPLTDKPFVRRFALKTSPSFVPLKMKGMECGMKRQHCDYFEFAINRFVYRTLCMLSYEKGKWNVNVVATACIGRDLWLDEAMQVLKEIKRDQVNDDDECSFDCAVCLDVVRLRWFDGVKLHCKHVFHVKCISPWLKKKNTCPMCRLMLF